MAKYHLTDDDPKRCVAQSDESCRAKTEDGKKSPHFGSLDQAATIYEKKQLKDRQMFNVVKTVVQDDDTVEESIDSEGARVWIKDGELHRENGPARILPDGTQEWHSEGFRYREDGPEVEKADGTKQWWNYGSPHREDGPAITDSDGNREWWAHGELDREEVAVVQDPENMITVAHGQSDDEDLNEDDDNYEW